MDIPKLLGSEGIRIRSRICKAEEEWEEEEEQEEAEEEPKWEEEW
ncbi:MAG: hypothetical protein OEZ35_00480 [Candidatus Bathyarchaeota archaeon]|nr:hypothetical protein [Candidatus Bathyarchaeota archaeon]